MNEVDPLPYTAGNATIDRLFVRFGEASYPISAITAVETRVRKGHAKVFAYGVTAALFGGVFFYGSIYDRSWTGLLMGGGVMIGGLIAVASSFLSVHQLVLRTSGGETIAQESGDASEIDRLKSAVETAIVASRQSAQTDTR